MRTGRASVHLLDGVKVPLYGVENALNAIATLTTPDGSTILVQPWDKNALAPIEKAILQANVGLTPDNRYQVLVDKQTRLVGEWTFYRAATDTAATFTMPWKDWRRVGSIMLCADHGREADWKLAVYASLPRSVFESPDPVHLQ